MSDEDFEELAVATQAAKTRYENLSMMNVHGRKPTEAAILSAQFREAQSRYFSMEQRLRSAAELRTGQWNQK